MFEDFADCVDRLRLCFVVRPRHDLPQKSHADQLYAHQDQEDTQKEKRSVGQLDVLHHPEYREIRRDREPGSEQTQPPCAEDLQRTDYQTMFAGKWHCSGDFESGTQPYPGDQGFDHWPANAKNFGKEPDRFAARKSGMIDLHREIRAEGPTYALGKSKAKKK